MRYVFAALALLLFAGPLRAQAPGAADLEKTGKTALLQKSRGDAAAVLRYRDGLSSVMLYVSSRTDVFSAREGAAALPNRAEKEIVWQTWKTFLDYQIALGSVEDYYRSFQALKGDSRDRSFLISYAAFLARYRFAMEWIAAMDRIPGADTLLNEPVPEMGLSKGVYDKIKFEFLNVAKATEFGAFEALYKVFGSKALPGLEPGIKSDSDYIWETGKFRGHVLTAKNALDIFKKAGGGAWFPVQAGLSEWMGDTKVYRVHESLITREQLRKIVPQLRPGDILLIRHEWYLSNVGLPGFWPHAALYIGTERERAAYFGDPAVRAWVRGQGRADGDFNGLLRDKYPDKYAKSFKQGKEDVRILEAISEGVSFTALEHAGDADSLVVLRPRLSKAEQAVALFRAFFYAGRPYDFNFDFMTDSAIVCTELVFKSYEPSDGYKGLKLPVSELLGRKVTPANEIARQFAAEYGAPAQQADFVLFLDGHEAEKKAVEAPVAEFLESWKRPKWHVIVQDRLAE